MFLLFVENNESYHWIQYGVHNVNVIKTRKICQLCKLIDAFYYPKIIQAMPLPMFTALRRFSILITMLLEFKILGVKPSLAVQLSVWSMIGGAILAASDDLSFTFEGYSYLMLANIITAAYGVVSVCECDLHIIVMF